MTPHAASDGPEPLDRRDDEIEITEEMIGAGARAFRKCDFRVDDATSVALTVFEAMWKARSRSQN
jgi:hypothetical protein